MRLQSWCFIIFGFNEAKNISGVIADAYDILQKISNQEGEIIIVDDGSTDNTARVIHDALGKISCARTIVHPVNYGIGAAIISGYKAASAENVCAIPADGQFDFAQLNQNPIIQPETILSFYRAKNDIYSPFRKILSWCNRQLLRFVFRVKVRDINWVKVYKRESLRSIKFDLSSSLVESEICIKLMRNGVRLIEVPTLYLPRTHGTSKGASLTIVLKALIELPKLFMVTFFSKPLK